LKRGKKIEKEGKREKEKDLKRRERR